MGRRGGLMVSALVSGSSGPGSSPGRVLFLGKTLAQELAQDTCPLVLGQDTLTVPLFNNLMLGVTLRWTSIPSRGE